MKNKHIGENKKYILNLTSVSKSFGSFKVLKEISFNMEKGDRIGIIGANGSGKTTLTEIISGISKPSSGNIDYGFKYKDSPKEKIGIQFQQSSFPSGLTVKDVIKFAINLRKLDIPENNIKKLLEKFKMDDFYNRKINHLSGGQKQKINIFMSLIHKPHLIIFDELSTGLDILAREEIFNFIDKLIIKNKVSTIFVSHHFEEVEKLCNRVIFFEAGTIIKDVQMKEVLSKHKSLGDYYRFIIDKTSREKDEAKKIKLNLISQKKRKRGK